MARRTEPSQQCFLAHEGDQTICAMKAKTAPGLFLSVALQLLKASCAVLPAGDLSAQGGFIWEQTVPSSNLVPLLYLNWENLSLVTYVIPPS